MVSKNDDRVEHLDQTALFALLEQQIRQKFGVNEREEEKNGLTKKTLGESQLELLNTLN